RFALAIEVADAAHLARVGRELVVAGRQRGAHGQRPFAARRFCRRRRDFAFAELDVDRDVGVFARRAFERRFDVVRAGFGAFGDFDFRRFGVDFEAHRRFALAIGVADAALLAPVAPELAAAGGQQFAQRRHRPFARRRRRRARRDFSCAELDVDYDFGVFARRPFEGRFGVAGAGFGAFGDRDVGRQRVDFEFDRVAFAVFVVDRAVLGRVGGELVVAVGQRYA